MFVVLDTNILVSGLLNAHGAPGRILDLLLAGQIQAVFDDRILAEYRDVLARPKFNFNAAHTASLLAFLRLSGKHVVAPPLPGIEIASLPDSDDLPFAEVAFAGNAAFIVTGNVKHFTFLAAYPISVLTPRQFMEAW
ncbi:MAG TPA: putative toxin-antitoxin system toxin component, PIN family [Anaerolineae bacterium]|nr:putative toxin-antitoxin system toxin component, PIN family [Anaerolineae bacterium]